MAEVIGVVASIVTLASLVQTTIELVRQDSKTPDQITQVSYELEELLIQLEFLVDVQQFAQISFCHDTKIISKLCQSLDRNIIEFKSIGDSLRKLSARSSGTKGRICWLLVGKNETISLFTRLQEIRTSLNLTLSLATMAINLLQLASRNKCEAPYGKCSRSAFERATPKEGVSLEPDCAWATINEGNISRCISSWPQASKPSTVSRAALLVPNIGRLAAASLLNMTSTMSRYELAFWLALPNSRVLVVRALLLSRSWLSFSIDSSIRTNRIVDNDSAIHQACVSGNTMEVKRLLLENPASVNDRTRGNESPLQMAICSRNSSTVRLLLDQGADVNELFGGNQTSPLAVAIRIRSAEIVRLLLEHNADCHHVTSYGWTPLFYLWWGPSNQFDFVDDAETILRILASRSDFLYTYSGVIDGLNFAAIHMAVMRGTISQMRFLLCQNPNLVHVKGFLGWTAVHVAVSEGRLDMLELLLPSYDQQDVITAKDDRGWTLLHTSAAEGESDVTKYLLKLGADWQALSDPSQIEVPQDLKGRSCTPLEAASAKSRARRSEFLKNVKEICGDICLSSEELEELDDEWTDAVSFLV